MDAELEWRGSQRVVGGDLRTQLVFVATSDIAAAHGLQMAEALEGRHGVSAEMRMADDASLADPSTFTPDTVLIVVGSPAISTSTAARPPAAFLAQSLGCSVMACISTSDGVDKFVLGQDPVPTVDARACFAEAPGAPSLASVAKSLVSLAFQGTTGRVSLKAELALKLASQAGNSAEAAQLERIERARTKLEAIGGGPDESPEDVQLRLALAASMEEAQAGGSGAASGGGEQAAVPAALIEEADAVAADPKATRITIRDSKLWPHHHSGTARYDPAVLDLAAGALRAAGRAAAPWLPLWQATPCSKPLPADAFQDPEAASRWLSTGCAGVLGSLGARRRLATRLRGCLGVALLQRAHADHAGVQEAALRLQLRLVRTPSGASSSVSAELQACRALEHCAALLTREGSGVVPDAVACHAMRLARGLCSVSSSAVSDLLELDGFLPAMLRWLASESSPLQHDALLLLQPVLRATERTSRDFVISSGVVERVLELASVPRSGAAGLELSAVALHTVAVLAELRDKKRPVTVASRLSEANAGRRLVEALRSMQEDAGVVAGGLRALAAVLERDRKTAGQATDAGMLKLLPQLMQRFGDLEVQRMGLGVAWELLVSQTKERHDAAIADGLQFTILNAMRLFPCESRIQSWGATVLRFLVRSSSGSSSGRLNALLEAGAVGVALATLRTRASDERTVRFASALLAELLMPRRGRGAEAGGGRQERARAQVVAEGGISALTTPMAIHSGDPSTCSSLFQALQTLVGDKDELRQRVALSQAPQLAAAAMFAHRQSPDTVRAAAQLLATVCMGHDGSAVERRRSQVWKLGVYFPTVRLVVAQLSSGAEAAATQAAMVLMRFLCERSDGRRKQFLKAGVVESLYQWTQVEDARRLDVRREATTAMCTMCRGDLPEAQEARWLLIDRGMGSELGPRLAQESEKDKVAAHWVMLLLLELMGDGQRGELVRAAFAAGAGALQLANVTQRHGDTAYILTDASKVFHQLVQGEGAAGRIQEMRGNVMVREATDAIYHRLRGGAGGSSSTIGEFRKQMGWG